MRLKNLILILAALATVFVMAACAGQSRVTRAARRISSSRRSRHLMSRSPPIRGRRIPAAAACSRGPSVRA